MHITIHITYTYNITYAHYITYYITCAHYFTYYITHYVCTLHIHITLQITLPITLHIPITKPRYPARARVGIVLHFVQTGGGVFLIHLLLIKYWLRPYLRKNI